MKKLVITVTKEADKKFMSELANRLGFKTEEITVDDEESYMFGQILESTDSSKPMMVREAKAAYQKLKKKK